MQNSSDNEAATATTTYSSPAAAATATSSASSSTLLHATMKPARSGKCLVTFSTYEDRQEALKRTTMMDDPTTYRAKGTRPPSKIETAEKTKEKTQQETSNNNSSSSSNNINNNNNNNNNISHIPKPPPMQLSPASTNKTQQFSEKSQAFNSAKSSSSSLYSNDLTSSGVTLRSSMSSANDGMGQNSEPSLYRNSNRNTSTVPLPINQNRQTLRLGTVTIGEYQQPGARKEPEKFDFIGSPTKRQESAATSASPTYQHETLQSELHSTLSRSKLKKTNGSVLEHQRNCPLHQSQQQQHQQQHNNHHHHHQHQHSSHHHQQQQPQYEYQNVNFNNTFSVSEMTNKLQKTSINGGGAGSSNHSPASTATTAGGILKNGNRNSSSSGSSNKSTEKSIKFG